MSLNMTPGLIPYPDIENDVLNVRSFRIKTNDCRGYDDLGFRPIIPEFLVLHKAQSPISPGVTLGSPSGYFTQACCPALTDLEIHPTTGRFRRFVDRGDAPSGWANGRVSAPYGDALKYLQFHNWDYNRVNRMGEAVEILGWFKSYPVTLETTVDEIAVKEIVQWIAARAHDYGIRWDTFPLIPNENNRSYITWHQEWTIGTGKVCPGSWVMQHTSEWIARAKEIMRAYQTAAVSGEVEPIPTHPVYADSVLPEWWADALAHRMPASTNVDGTRWYVCRTRVRALNRTIRRSRPDSKSDPSGPAIEEKESITVERTFQLPNGQRWYVEDAGHFVLWSKFSPRVRIDSV